MKEQNSIHISYILKPQKNLSEMRGGRVASILRRKISENLES